MRDLILWHPRRSGGRVRRRELITLLGGAAVGWPLIARSQQAGARPTIGFLGPTTPSAQTQWIAAFLERLGELGWVEGRTVAIAYRWAEGHTERVTEIATEFVQLKVDVIVTYGTPQVIAAKQATSVIPIVFALVGDPVGTGLVASLARPGANVTGLSLLSTDTATKRIELLREAVSSLRRLAILANTGNPISRLEMGGVQTAARMLGLEVTTSEIRRAEDIASAIETLKGRADALYVVGDTLLNAHRISINTLAMGARLPTMYIQQEFVEAGGLISYGPNFPDLFRRAAGYVDKILRGAKPAEIPVEQPTKFDLVVNIKTAKALGIALPPSLLARANEVIENQLLSTDLAASAQGRSGTLLPCRPPRPTRPLMKGGEAKDCDLAGLSIWSVGDGWPVFAVTHNTQFAVWRW